MIFQNTSAKAVDLTRMTYNGEVLRTNSTANVSETVTPYFRVTDSQAAALTMTTVNKSGTQAAIDFPNDGTPTAGFFLTGWTAIPGGSFIYINGSAAAQVNDSLTIDTGSLTGIRVGPGKFLAVRFSNINGAGTDALMGVDDIEMTFTEVNAAVIPSVSNIVRNNNGTPTTPTDDTVGFDLTVSGIGSVSPAGWTITSPASLAGTTGTYGTAKPIAGVSIAAFAGAGHTLDVAVEDQGAPAVNGTVTVTAPWTVLTPVITNLVRDSMGNADPNDDTWSYTVTVNGQFTGPAFTSDNFAIPSPGSYGTPYTVGPLFIFQTSETTNFTDVADPTATASITVSPPRIIGTKNFGVAQPLFSDISGVPVNWAVDETLRTQTMANGGGAPPKVYRSEIVDLTSIGIIAFRGSLAVTDLTSGFEAADTFRAQLIVDGDTANPVSLITPYDTLVPADGVMTGAELSPATVGPPPATGSGSFLHTFSAIIPASANSVQLIISGNNDSGNEIMTMQDIVFELAAHAIQATLAGGPQFDNKGTLDPGDDVYRQGVNILAVSPPPASTGWTSNLTPAAGLYTDPSPVLFGPFTPLAGLQVLTLADNNVPAVTTSINISPPVTDIVTSLVEASIIRNDNGFPDPADDTLTVQFQVSAPVGGPSFLLETYPGGASAPSMTMSGTSQVVTVTLTHIPDHGPVHLTIRDASYPGSADRYTITVPPVPVGQYVVAEKNLGGGLSDVLTIPNSPLPPEWTNYPSVPALQMNNGGGVPEKVITSRIIDLTGVNGPVNFTANLRATDFTSGFEASDTFKAELILDGDTLNPVNLISPHDIDFNGVLSGPELVPVPPINPTVQVFNYPLSYIIPDNVLNAQLIITAVNDSANEMILFENALFAAGAAPPIVPGAGSLALKVGVSGKLTSASLVALATGGSGPLSISGVQAGPTPRGGRVTLQGGWLVYEPAPGISGVDTFTYSLTDGSQTVSGTVTVVISTTTGQTFNIAGIVSEAAGNRLGGMGIPGRFYHWEHSADLTVWTPFSAPAACPANGVMTFLDPAPVPSPRFYRLIEGNPL